MYIAPRPPPRPRPRPRGLRAAARPLPPRLPRPPLLPRPLVSLIISGDFKNGSSIFGNVVSRTTLRSGLLPNSCKSVEEFRPLLVRGVEHIDGILSSASVMRGNLIRELVGSISSSGFWSTKNLLAVSTTGSTSGAGFASVSSRRPLPRPLPLGFTSITGRSL